MLAIDRLMKVNEVLEMVGLARPTLYCRIKAGTFPRPVKAGKRAARWRLSEVQQWIADLPQSTGDLGTWEAAKA